MLQNIVNSFIDIFNAIELKPRALTDGLMECMQFGICSFVPKPSEEIPYFHYYFGAYVYIDSRKS
jgi:hypothetical protein